MKDKNVIFWAVLIITLIAISTANSQPNFRSAPVEPDRNFYDVRTEFNDWYDNSNSPDLLLARTAKRFGRFEYFWASRVGSNDASKNGRFSNWAESFNTYVNSSWTDAYCANQDKAEWKSLGPYPVSSKMTMGLVSAIWCDPADPNFVLIGSGRKGGIMRTTNRTYWEDVTSPQRLPVFGVNSIAVSPNRNGQKRVIYAATGGDYSIGIIKSVDDGDTWEILENFPPYLAGLVSYRVLKVLVPQNLAGNQADIVYAIANNTFHSSSDGGISWNINPYQFSNTGILCDIEVDPTNYSKIVVSSHASSTQRAEVWLSEDSGNSWTEILGNLLTQYPSLPQPNVAILSQPTSSRIYVLIANGNNREVAYTDDKGMNWVLMTGNYSPVAHSQFNYAFEVSRDYSTIYVGTEYFVVNKIIRIDYATTSDTHCDIRCFQLIYDSNNEVSRIVVGTDGGVTESVNNGLSWSTLNIPGSNGLVNSEIHGFDVCESTENIVAGLMDNGMTIRDDNQFNYIPGFFKDGERVVFHPANANVFYAMLNCVVYRMEKVGGGYISTWMPSEQSVGCYSSNPLPNTWLGRPLVVSNQYPYILYTGLKGGQINRINLSASTPQWDTPITLDPMAPPEIAMDVVAIRIAPSDPSIVYAATNYSTTDQYAIYRSNNYGAAGSWTDISGGFNNKYSGITDIAVDSDNPNRIWITKGGVWFYNGTAHNRVFRTDDATQGSSTVWYDMTSGLPSLPVTSIVHQPGTSDRVFIASDAGIFYWDGDLNRWECFSNGLPMTFVTQLKINRKTQEIYASTYGRGMWKSKLPCIEGQQSYVCDDNTGNLTWDKDKYIGGDIHISDGYTLTITNDAVISMGENTKITVMEGGKLVVDNAMITSGCNGMWQGIELHGDYADPQTSANKGVVELKNGAVIENARIGVSTFPLPASCFGSCVGTGGIIKAENATFRNCQIAVRMLPYKNIHPTLNRVVADQSYFIKCRFETTAELSAPATYPDCFIEIDGINYLRIRGNTFENTYTAETQMQNRGMGIRSNNSIFTVKDYCPGPQIPCNQQTTSNTFKGLYFGVKAQSDGPGYPVTIENCVFDNNHRGVYLGAVSSASVTQNTFSVSLNNDDSKPYGLYLDNCSGYTVEENSFASVSGVSLYNQPGMIINNSGDASNEVYNNYFSNLSHGMLAQHDNRGIDDLSGLKIKCNDFTGITHTDIAVTKEPGYAGVLGVSKFQGSDVSVTSPAGNTFTRPNSNAFSDLNNLGLPISKYYHHDISGSIPLATENWAPLYIDNTKVLREEADGEFYSKPNACPPRPDYSLLNISQLYQKVHDAQVYVQSSELVLAIWMDGGISDLPEQVELAYPWETLDMYNTLMLASPYLSDETMIEAINNTALLPDLLLKLVLIANPHCTRSDVVMQTLEERTPPLPQGMIDEIMMGEDVPSPLDALKATVSYYIHERQNAINRIKMVYLNDTVEEFATDSLLAVLGRDQCRRSAFEKAFVYLYLGNYTSFDDVMNSIQLQLDGSEYQMQEFQEYSEYMSVIKDMMENNKAWSDLDGAQKDLLIGLAQNGIYYPAACARALLLKNEEEYIYEPPIIFPVVNYSRKAKPMSSLVSSEAYMLIVYPNPASDYVVADYRLKEADKKAEIRIIDNSGRLIRSIAVNRTAGQEVIDCRALPGGLYIFSLYVNGRNTVSRKVSVHK